MICGCSKEFKCLLKVKFKDNLSVKILGYINYMNEWMVLS